MNNLIDFHKALVPFYEAPFLYFGQNKISLNKIKTTNINSNNHLGYIEKSKNNYFLNLRDKKVKLIETSIDLKELEKIFII